MKTFLLILNVLIYVGLGALWIMFPMNKTLNFSLTIFNLSFTSLLLYQHNDRINQKAGKKKKNKVTYAIINLMLITVVFAFLNYLSFSNSSQFDLTKNRVNSVTEETKKLLVGVEGELKFEIFAKRKSRNSILEILELYRQSKNDLKIEFIDAQARPDLVKANDIERIPTIQIGYKGKKELVTEITEAEITNAIMRLARGDDFKVYYTIGHNELTIEDSSEQGMSSISPLATKRMYQFKPLSFGHYGRVPEDADILLVWGPKVAFSLGEIEKIEEFLKKGGKLQVALDPEVNEEKLTSLREFLSRWGVKIQNTLVMDRESFVDGSNGSVPIAKSYNKSHEIYKKISPPIFFPLTSMVQGGEAKVLKGVFRPLLFSSNHPGSWADITPTEIISGEVLYNYGEDIKRSDSSRRNMGRGSR